MPTSIMQKNYSHCPLKKRPVFFVKEETEVEVEVETELEPENLSTKPEDLSRTGKYPSNMPPAKMIKSEETEQKRTVSPPAPQTPEYPTSKSPATTPLNLHSPKSQSPVPSEASPVSSPVEPINFSSASSWHKPIASPTSYPSYLPFPAYPLPYATEAYNHLYHHQISPIRDSSMSPPSYLMATNRMIRESSVSPPAPVFMPPYTTTDYRRTNVIKTDQFSQHRYMPYQLNHHHHNLLTVDQSSLSPTSSHASYNSFVSSSTSSRCSISPASTPSTPEDLTSNYSISVLMEKSNSTSNIQKPMKSEKSEKSSVPPRYQCPDCGKSYSTYSGLSKHQQFHCAANENNQAQKTVTCNDCGKVYASSGALKMHIRTHTLPCKCHLCGKAFSRPWLLQGHIRTHTGEKPFSCQHCHRAFADRSNLRAHLQTHSDVKKYSCNSCSKTFSRMSLLTKHSESGCPGLQSPQNGYVNQLVPNKDIAVY